MNTDKSLDCLEEEERKEGQKEGRKEGKKSLFSGLASIPNIKNPSTLLLPWNEQCSRVYMSKRVTQESLFIQD